MDPLDLNNEIKRRLLAYRTVIALWRNIEVHGIYPVYAIIRLTPLAYGKYRAERYISSTKAWRYVGHGSVIDGFNRLHTIIDEASVEESAQLMDMQNAEWHDITVDTWRAYDVAGFEPREREGAHGRTHLGIAGRAAE